MSPEHDARVEPAPEERRRVEVQTIHEAVEGYLGTGGSLRTLDNLNIVSPGFLVLDVDKAPSDGWFLSKGRASINTASILFVRELSESRPRGERVEAARFSRSPVRLRVGDCEIRGFMHVPGRGDPMWRLNHEKCKFIAVTSASVVGPGIEYAAPFLAVNRLNISAAQEICLDESESEQRLCTADVGGA